MDNYGFNDLNNNHYDNNSKRWKPTDKIHNITPQTIQKSIRDTIKASYVEDIQEEYKLDKNANMQDVINKLTDEMLKYAADMEFEKAAELRDKIKELENLT